MTMIHSPLDPRIMIATTAPCAQVTEASTPMAASVMQRSTRAWQQGPRGNAVVVRQPSVACSCSMLLWPNITPKHSHRGAHIIEQQPRTGSSWLSITAACIVASCSPAGLLTAQPALAGDAAINEPACLTAQLQEDTSTQQQMQSTGLQNQLAAIAALFGREERDPIDPFTIYGTTTKKFVIEQLDGEKIVARKRGFTVETCVANETSAQEKPDLAFRPTRDKVATSDNKVCKQATGSELQGTCLSSCEQACAAGLDVWAASNIERTGFQLLPEDRARLLRSCTRECTQDCIRPGKAYDFAIPYRK